MNQELQDQINLQKENEKWKNLLQSHLFSVCKIMDPDTGLIDCLLADRVLNKRAAETCQTKGTKYKRNHAVLDIVLRRSFDDFVKLCKALCKTEQSHIIEGFFDPEKINSMCSSHSLGNIAREATPDATDAVPDEAVTPFDWRAFIKKHLTVFIEVIDPDNGLIKALAFRKVIPEWLTDKYTNIEGRSSRVEALLVDLIRKGDNDYRKFCEALKETNQQHVVDDYLSQDAVGCYRHILRRSQTSTDGITNKENPVVCNWKHILVRQQSKLIDDLNPSPDLINHLEKTDVMNRRCAERCKEIQNESDRTAFILDFMKLRPDRDFSHFCQGLVLTDQQHIVNTYFKGDESISAAVQESVSAAVDQLRMGDGFGEHDHLNGERHVVINRQPQPTGNGNRNFGKGGQHVGVGREGFVVAVHPSEENTVPSLQEHGDVNLIEDEDTCHVPAVEYQGTTRHEDESGYNSRTDALHFDEVHHLTASTDRSWELPSGDQLLARNPVACHDDPVYGSRPTRIDVVDVRHSSHEFYVEHRETSYPMNKVCRGRCIIFNNHQFIRMRERMGTEMDAALLLKLFRKLFFKVEEIKDATTEEIKSKLRAISQDRTLENDQCLVIFVLSHGDYQNGQCIIYGSDERPFTLEDVLNPFVPSSCGYMNGKPKLVFIQACRGEQYDYSESDAPTVKKNQPSPSISYPDFIVGFPTQAGYRAFRDIENGSWYINALTRTFMARAHNTGLNSMMNLVAGAASKWLSQTGSLETDNKTQFAIYTCSFTKDLFFFPGIFE